MRIPHRMGLEPKVNSNRCKGRIRTPRQPEKVPDSDRKNCLQITHCMGLRESLFLVWP